MFKAKDKIELKVSKHVEDLKGLEDVLAAPRSWSPSDLRDVAKNLDIQYLSSTRDLDNLEEALIIFIIKEFFFLEHQSGLYNAQKALWSTIARTKKVVIKPYKALFLKNQPRITDLCFYDDVNRFIKLRLVHPIAGLVNGIEENSLDSIRETLSLGEVGQSADLLKSYQKFLRNPPGFKNLVARVPANCCGVFYVSNLPYTNAFLQKTAKKTNSEHFYDRYKSPIRENCSLNLMQYHAYSEEGKEEYIFGLVHPSINRTLSAKITLS